MSECPSSENLQCPLEVVGRAATSPFPRRIGPLASPMQHEVEAADYRVLIQGERFEPGQIGGIDLSGPVQQEIGGGQAVCHGPQGWPPGQPIVKGHQPAEIAQGWAEAAQLPVDDRA